MTAIATETTNPHHFIQEVIDSTPGRSRLEMCIQCGTCAGSCPSGPDMDHSPRQMIAMIRAGRREEVMQSNTYWYCVSCYYCMTRCPQDVHVADVMYTLKRMSVRSGHQRHGAAPDFSRTFIDFVEQYGRSFEVGLAARYHATHKPWRKFNLGPMALSLLQHDRLALRPKRIRDIAGLQAILNKAKALTHEAELAGEAMYL